MKEEQIEQSLRERPEVVVPPGLRARLRSQININPQDASSVAQMQSLWRRWFPAWSLALLMAGCLVVIGVQTSQLLQVRSATRAIEQQIELQQASDAVPVTTVEASAEFASRTAEAQNLRAEIEQLKEQMLEAQQLKSENEALRKQLAAASSPATTEDPFAAQKAKAERVRCINNIKQIGLASRMWLNANGSVNPPDFQAMQKQLKTPALLVCPSDAANLPAPASWELFEPRRVSYDWLAANHSEGAPDQVITRCRIHHNAGLADGSAHQLDPSAVEYVTENGVVKMRRKAAIISYPFNTYE